MFRRLWFSLGLPLVSLVFAHGASPECTFYVAQDGTAEGQGTVAHPLSLAAARQKACAAAGDAEIVLLPGIYFLKEPLVFTAEDTQKLRCIRAQNDEADPSAQVVLSGGLPLKLKWVSADGLNGVFKATVPEGVKPFDQLFLNGKLQVLARYPNYNPKAKYLNGTARDATEPGRVSRWKNPAGGFIHALHRGHWGDFHYAITGKTSDGKLKYEGGWGNNRPEQGPSRDQRFVEGIFEELDAPGEWFYESATRTLYFFPPSGVSLDKADILVPQLEMLIHFKGTRAAPVSRLSIQGLTYKHTLRTFMKKREPLQRSDWCVFRGGAILFENAEKCSLSDSNFHELGGNAICLNNYNRNITISGSHFDSIGANGVIFVGDPKVARSPLFHYRKTQTIEEMDQTPGPNGDNYPQDCAVSDCLITRIGTVEKQSAGVNIDLAARVSLSHCTIANVPRAGINIGSGTWGGHHIVHSDIFDTVRETGDHGSFNSWGRDRFWYPDRRITDRHVAAHPSLPFWDVVEEIVIDHNRWRCDHGWDIDLDDGSSRYRITNNLCLNGGIKLREGYGRIVENNITVNNGFHPHCWYAESNDIVRRNIFFKKYAPSHMGRAWGKEMDYNLVHEQGVKGESPATELQKQSQQDKHSIVADMRFLSPETGEYGVAENSPALALGFKNFPMDNFGVKSARLRAIAPKVDFPSILTGQELASTRSNRVVSWQGARVKNIVGLGEKSAVGLMDETGVLVVEEADKSPTFTKYKVQDGDVILRWGNAQIDDFSSLRAAEKANPAPEKIEIWRQQKPFILKAAQ
jgi:hypothetical protein